jgi:hypothetical protein
VEERSLCKNYIRISLPEGYSKCCVEFCMNKFSLKEEVQSWQGLEGSKKNPTYGKSFLPPFSLLAF